MMPKVPVIEYRDNNSKCKSNRWRPLRSANETPTYPCRIGRKRGLVASAWLRIHTDESAYDETDHIQIITPFFIREAMEPTLLVTCDGQLAEQPLKIGASFAVDLFLPHALLPRRIALEVLRRGTDAFPEFEAWWDPLYKFENVKPVFVWASENANGKTV